MCIYILGFPGGMSGKEPACLCRRHKRCEVQSLGQEDPLEEGMATHSSILAWRIPWTEEPRGPQSMGLYSPVPGILQARTLEWVAISFSNA